MHERRRIIIPIVVILIVGSLAIWYLARENRAAANGLAQASGTIEAAEVVISPELSGRIAQVMVAKGDQVDAGQPLLQLDDELLQVQRQRAAAALESAQASLVTTQTGVDTAQSALRGAQTNLEIARANAQAELLVAQKALDDLYDNAAVLRAETARNMAAADRAVRDAQYLLDNFTIPTTQEKYTAVEAILITRQLLDQARADFEPYRNESSGNQTREDLKEALDEAQSEYDTAVRRLELETALAQAKARLEKLTQDVQTLQNGPNPKDIAALDARIAAIQSAPKQAEAAVDQAQMNLAQAEARLAQAGTAVQQAQTELDWIDVQIKKLTVYAPIASMVLARNIEPGEVVQAGAPVMRLGQIDDLKITVYIPEDRYGQIKLGEKALVTVDSFPGEQFEAIVVYIADKAEFTPRNVQTAEGRKTTVFAVELTIPNNAGKLKPGMPADVRFTGK
jgi:multidrug resistance efflux pump